MSIYQINKVLREVGQDLSARQEFIEHRSDYLKGKDLTKEESLALETIDFGSLYSFGAHPFILWSFVGAVLPASEPGFRKYYVSTISQFGPVDFGT